jgi:acyl-CoA thioester hydrolase
MTETKKNAPFLAAPPVVARLQVRYADLDTYGHVNNAVHLSYFEAARISYMAAAAEAADLKGAAGEWDVGGAGFVIAEATVRYKAPIRLADDLRCGISVRSVSRRSFVWDYDLRAADPDYEGGRPLAEATTAQVFYDLETGGSRPRPDWFLPAVALLEGEPEDQLLATPARTG